MTTPPYAVVFTFRSEDDNTALVFTASVDSARGRLRTRERGIPVIVVDDCSPGTLWKASLTAYEEMGEEIQVLRMGPPTVQSAFLHGATAPSFGQAPALDRGFWWARYRLGCTRVLALDGDVLILADDAVEQVDAAMTLLDGTTVIAGEWVGTPEDWTLQPQTSGVYWYERPGGGVPKSEYPTVIPAPIRAHGYVPMTCAAVDLGAFWHPRSACLVNSGWVSGIWYYSQMALGKRSAYYPFFRSGMAAHLGRASVSVSRGWSVFGNALGVRYAGKGLGNYYAGYLQIADAGLFLAALRNRPPGEPTASALFVPPEAPEIVPMGPHLRYAGPVERLDSKSMRLGFEYAIDGEVSGRATVTLDGDVLRVESIDAAEVGPIYSEICEHATAMLRYVVSTPAALYAAARADRGAHEVKVDGEAWAVWEHALYIRSLPQHRWATHFDWDGLGVGMLDPLEDL